MTATASIWVYGEVNPRTPEFSTVKEGDTVSFVPLEAVWPDGHADFSRTIEWKKELGYTEFRRGDVLVPKITPTFEAGRSCIAHTPYDVGVATTEVYVLRARDNADARFLSYVVRSIPFLDEGAHSLQGVGNLRRITPRFLASFPIPETPLETQRAIADYLDRETTEIDSMLAELDDLVALLEERRKVEVSHLVNDLDGKYPRKSIGSVANMHAGDFLPASKIQEKGPVPVYGGNGIRGYFTKANCNKDRVLIGRQGALCGNVHVATGPFWATEHAIVCEPFFDVDLYWFAHTLREKNLGNLSTAAAQPGISVSAVARQTISYPPLCVQREIGKNLTDLDSQVDSMLSDAAELKSLLLERRSALITDVVTGRKQVV